MDDDNQLAHLIEQGNKDYDGTITDMCVNVAILSYFGQLIVKECADVCFVDDGPQWAHYYSRKIKKHFGIEE